MPCRTPWTPPPSTPPSPDPAQVEFEPGSLLVLYSDGIIEAMNAADEEFGAERLESFVAGHIHEPARALIELVLTEVQRHAGGFPQHDDMTLLVLRRVGAQPGAPPA